MINCAEIAKQVSKSFYKSNPHLNYDDIVGEALDAMIHAIDTHDPIKGRSLHSWIGFIVHRELRKTFKGFESELEFLDYFTESTIYNPERIAIFKETVENFSDASKQILLIIFNGELPTTCSGKNEVKRELKNKLREYGFAWNKIQKAFSELREYANTV